MVAPKATTFLINSPPASLASVVSGIAMFKILSFLSLAEETFNYAIGIVVHNRDHIIAAAQRHNFIPGDVCNATDSEKQEGSSS